LIASSPILIAGVAEAETPGCPVAFEVAPSWSASAAWNADETALAVVDALHRQILVYDLDGSLVDAVAELRTRVETPVPLKRKVRFAPATIHSFSDGYLVENGKGHLLLLDAGFRLEQAIPIIGRTNAAGERIGSLNGWTLDGEDLVGFSDLETGDGWRCGFIRVPVAEPDGFTVIDSLAIDDPARAFYLTGQAFFAGAGERCFILRMDPPAIVPARTGGGKAFRRPQLKTAAAIEEFNHQPALPKMDGYENPADVFAALEATRPVGIYGQGDGLFALTRQATDGGTVWKLSRLDPADREAPQTFYLPTTANHLVVVPGEKHWALIEKGPVIDLGVQEIASMRLVPSEWLSGEKSPLSEPGFDFGCRDD